MSGREMASNVELLTHAYKVIKAKKRQQTRQVKAVVFDEDARREFLTGFHKRKLAKKEESKKKAQVREKEEHLEARRERRRILAEQAAQNAAKVEEAYSGVAQPVDWDSDSHGEEWTGIDAEHGGAEPHEYAYSDEEQLATVTVVEDFDPSTLLHGAAASEEQRERAFPPPPRRGKVEGRNELGSATSNGKKKDGAAKKVRYETKAARRATRATQHARRTEKAERAGGKAARNKAGGKKRKQKVSRG